jgi:class 3 adenylate cyclase/tetratricopeptide (TPR) repeat protein
MHGGKSAAYTPGVLTCDRCGRTSPEGFAFCGFCGAPLGADGAEVRKLVTVVFCDLTGSTSLGEQLDPESVREVVTRFFDLAREVLERHGGTIEKFIGDAVMAVFGVPEMHEDDALRAVRAAADLLDGLAPLNDELASRYGIRIRIRTGVNTGEVVAGDPAAGQAFVSGDAVNVAARLEQAAQPDEILIGAETLALTRDAVRIQAIEPLTLKGKAEPVPAFRLLDVSRQGPSIAPRLDAPLVGRAEELATLLAAFDRVCEQRTCELITVRGDAGVGKSRLIREMSSRLADRARILEGHCLSYGEGITFWPIAEIARAAAEIDEHDAPAEAQRKISDLVPKDDQEAALIGERVANAIGLGGGDSSIQETFWAIRRLLETLADERPLVAVIDDIHWASPTLLDLIEYVARFSDGYPLLVVCTARHDLREEHPEWGRDDATISLQPLTPDDSARLVDQLLDHAELADDVRSSIVEPADGNPLFLEEMVRALLDDGSLRRDGGRWVAGVRSTGGAAPTTVQALIAARLDRLHEEERSVLQRGSVVGKVFYWGAVTELSPAPARGEVGGHLQTLTRREFIAPEASTLAGEDAFRFSHILVHDAAYTSTPKRTRADLHERFATWLERMAGSRLPEFDEIVGYHRERAFRYLEELGPVDDRARELASSGAARLAAAGLRASARGDVSAATNLLSRATAILPRLDPARVELLPVLGGALTEAGRWQEADETLQAGIEEARKVGDARSEGLALIKVLWIRLHDGSFDSNADAWPDIERATSLFDDLQDDVGLAEVWTLRGSIDFWAGNSQGAVEGVDRALEHIRRAGDARRELDALRLRSFWQVWGPTPVREALEGVDELERHPAAGNPMFRAHTARLRGYLDAMLGNFDRAHEMFERSRRAALELGLEVDSISAQNGAGYASMLEGDHVAAEASLTEAVAFFREMGDVGHLSSYAPQLADEVSAQGRHAEALALTQEAEHAAIEGDTDAQVHWRRVQGKIMARLGNLDEGLRLVTEAADMARRSDDLDKLGRALLDLAEVLRMAGRQVDALVAANEAMAAYGQKGNVVLASRARVLADAIAAEV